MIVAFDMDDTLYLELTYVRSGFRAVAKAAADAWGIDAEEAFEVLWRSLERDGRGRQLNALGAHYGYTGKGWVRRWLGVYRQHQPDIVLPEWSRRVLEVLGEAHRLYLVTDGHKGVQARKVEALGLPPFFEHCYLTNRYGVRHQKPSPRVFELMQRRERCKPEAIVYIGDNPRKDFCGIRPLGMRTIRVLQGNHAAVEVAPSMDAEVTVASLEEVMPIVQSWARSVG